MFDDYTPSAYELAYQYLASSPYFTVASLNAMSGDELIVTADRLWIDDHMDCDDCPF